jgi:hypothetical protein
LSDPVDASPWRESASRTGADGRYYSAEKDSPTGYSGLSTWSLFGGIVSGLYCFSQGTHLWPADRDGRTEVLRWMYFEQCSHEPMLAVMRYLRHFS